MILSQKKEVFVPYDIPNSWAWSTLSNVLDVRDGTHDSPKYYSSGIPLITSKNISTGQLSFDNVKYILKEDADMINLRSKVDYGDILFAMIGSIGNPVQVQTNQEFAIKNMALFKRFQNCNMNIDYVMMFLDFSQYDMKKQASGGVQSFVSLSYLRNYFIPVPPLAEQERIVKIVNKVLCLF
jgi:type I restriction enzyme S subunit